jgi:Ca-activated chloride channel homolog
MGGSPLALVKQALTQVASQMTDRDRMSVILYGDDPHVWLTPTSIKGNREAVLQRISEIESSGSTNMEAGLKLGFATAQDDAPRFRGNTRVMLFTDEQPNVGATDAGSFMGMASAASREGIGMTTIGVGVQYDGALATKIGSVRGGNLFFVEDEARVTKLFKEELNTMVSEIAHDIHIAMTPAEGYSVSGVFGVPDGLMEQGRDGRVEITVPTAFFSTEAGGIFVSLAKDSKRANLPTLALDAGQPLMAVTLDYVARDTGKRAHDTLSVAAPTGGTPSAALLKAHALVDEYLVLKQATLAYHRDGKAKEAHRLLSGLSARLAGIEGEDMEQEMQLVNAMTEKAALMSGYAGEVSTAIKTAALEGEWEVRGVEGLSDLARGDRLRFDSEGAEMTTLRRHAARDRDEEESEAFTFDGNKLSLPESKLELAYRSFGDRVRLRVNEAGGPVEINLRRVMN